MEWGNCLVFILYASEKLFIPSHAIKLSLESITNMQSTKSTNVPTSACSRFHDQAYYGNFKQMSACS